MYSSFNNFSNNDVINYFEEIGVKTKVERGNRVFPVSDNAIDVVSALKKELKKYNVKVIYNTKLNDLIVKDGVLDGIVLSNGKVEKCDKCIIATGGTSYKNTGSSGDCYAVAKKVGHNIIDILPGLVPLRSNDDICKKLQGLSLKNIEFRLQYEDGTIIYQDFGEMLFAHFGITGPVVLSSSSKLNREKDIKEKLKRKSVKAIIDLKPALSEETLDKRICRDFEKYCNKEFKNALNDLLPQKLIPVIIQISGIDENKKVNQITKEERKSLVHVLKNLSVTISDFMPIDIAIITCGGIDTKQVNPKTMESKIIKGLFFAGEILDVDAYTGGFNLQIAFSTGVAAGKD